MYENCDVSFACLPDFPFQPLELFFAEYGAVVSVENDAAKFAEVECVICFLFRHFLFKNLVFKIVGRYGVVVAEDEFGGNRF